MKVRKAVITAGGWGTRFLPITRSQPKEMLPLINKPLIQYAVEEAIGSGIEQVIMVTAMGKDAIEDYFDRSFELEYFLEQKGQTELLNQMRELSGMVDVCYIRQKEQKGLGHAILKTKSLVGDEPFAVILPDDIVDSKVPALKQMIDVYEQHQGSVIAVEQVSREAISSYGIVAPKGIAERLYQIMSMVEKPEPEQAPSNLGIVGRYILMPEIFEALEATPPGKNNEIQLTDALKLLLEKQAMYACEFEGTRYDTGNPLGWLKASLAYALKDPELGPELRKYISSLL
jgi:UTP--glucose-1-phosphate uridylyltransferase